MFKFAAQAPSLFSYSRIHVVFALVLSAALTCAAQAKPAPDPDVLVLKNGDTLHGKLVSSVGGKVNFHTDSLGDISVKWEDVKELHTAGNFAVLDSTVKLRSKKHVPQIPVGKIDFNDQSVTVHPESGPAPSPIASKNAEYIMDQATLNKEVYHHPELRCGVEWGGNRWSHAGLGHAEPIHFFRRDSADAGGAHGGLARSAQSHLGRFHGIVRQDH